MNNILNVEHLHKHYGKRCILNDISFTIQEGECVALLGHNGAGKSTTLECILQVKDYERGTIHIFDKGIKGKDRQLFQNIGVQFQESAYPDRLRVKEACELSASMYDHCQDWKEMLKQFHLDTLAKHYINELSGGERQCLSVLLAMLPQPQLLFLDEVTTGLDSEARRELWKYILDYKQQNNSILLTSHYMDEVETLCDRIAILKDGHFVFIGTVEEAKAISGCAALEDAYLWFHEEGK